MTAALGACAPAVWSGGAVASALQFFAAAQCVLREPYPDNAHLPSGTAGALLAARLAERADWRVLLLEAGGDPPQDSIIPGFSHAMTGGEYDWNLVSSNDSVSSQALIDGAQPLPRGRMLGGSGSLNDMVYARGFPDDYDEWAVMLRDQDWNWEHVLPYFKKTEHLTDERIINDPELMELHGRGGDIEVAGFNESSYETTLFLELFELLGFEIVDDMTNPHRIGAGRHSHTIRDGRRDSTLTAILNKAAVKDNLFVLKNAYVTKILIAHKRAYGVKAMIGKQEMHFYAGKEVIVCAGAYNTPKLLMLSGIGPREHLEEMNITVVEDLPVGDHLQDHVMVLSYVAAGNGTCPANGARGHMATIQYLYDRSGPLSYVDTMTAYHTLRNSTNKKIPDFAYYPSCMPIGTPFYYACLNMLRFNEQICTRLNDVLKEQELLTVATVLLKPESTGSVRLRSADPFDKPVIHSGTLSEESDLDGYVEALKLVRDLAETIWWTKAKLIEFDLDVCEGKVGEELVKCRARAVALSAWHAAGTAGMGRVVDARLRVRGVASLRVADASVMPRVIRGNTNAPVVMIAEKTADYIRTDYKL